MRYGRWIILVLIFGLFFVFSQWPDDQLHVWFCDVGQGDATVIVKGKFQVLVDTGPDINKLDTCLSEALPFWDREIEAVYISHDQKDHAGALTELKKRFKIDKLLTKTKTNDLLRYGSLQIDTLKGVDPDAYVDKNNSTAVNDESVILRMVYNKFSVLFTGDIDEKAELALLTSGVLKETQVLKVAHHGSKYGSTNIFLDVVKPKLAVVSVGANNNYGHPNGDTLIRLESVGAKVLRTDKMGSVEINSDGDKVSIVTTKRD